MLLLAPEVHAQVCEAITSKRFPTNTTQANLLEEEDYQLTEEELSDIMSDEIPLPFSFVLALSRNKTNRSKLPSNAIVIEDPVEQYY